MSKRKNKKLRRFNNTVDTSKLSNIIKDISGIEPNSLTPNSISNLLKDLYPIFSDKLDEMNELLGEVKDCVDNGSLDTNSEYHDIIIIRENVKAEKQLRRVHELNQGIINWYIGINQEG